MFGFCLFAFSMGIATLEIILHFQANEKIKISKTTITLMTFSFFYYLIDGELYENKIFKCIMSCFKKKGSKKSFLTEKKNSWSERLIGFDSTYRSRNPTSRIEEKELHKIRRKKNI